MAIYHVSIKSFSRGKGQSSVAAAAYRAGINLRDTTHKTTHKYGKRSGVVSQQMLAPDGAPRWCLNVRSFWDINESPLKNPSQTSSAMFADHMVLEGVEERARTTCNQARKNAIQRSSQRRL
ncbi:hypothetical protein B7L66_12080 [Xanthomonas citri pv. citri]|nr:hypothetical protein B7L66_12080 [Xanthomonas citri pv. citri]